MQQLLSGYKTYILAGAAALVGAWMTVHTGSFDPAAAEKTLEAVAIMALRAGVAKMGSAAPPSSS